MNFKQIHKLALKTAGTIVIFFACLFLIFNFSFDLKIDLPKVIFFLFLFFVFIALIVKLNVEQFSSKKIQNIYSNSSLFKNINFDDDSLKPDIETFFNHVNDIIDRKHEEVDKLLSRDDFRREFLGNVSHELKTPLFTAQGYVLTLLEGSIDDVDLQKKYLDRANKSIERLNFIVKDLDMISKLESGMKLNYETFNIIKLITDAFELLEIKARKRNITLAFDKAYEFPLLVTGDIERIEQVLINLLVNSINYGKENGTSTVSVKLFSKNRFKIEILDDGIGIKNKNISRLFERFYRVDTSRSRGQGGSGLGLAIVKHIIEAHNQEVSAKSKLGSGSTFSFTLKRVI
ncbi:MAG: ATP-binding protein [Flavobacteriaceae bacterium]|nr:ATP-binding protein [Flavobacteriaceae bacterium]